MADKVGEVFKTEAEYEAMTLDQLNEAYSDAEVKEILQKVFGLDSVVYFIDKVQKMTYITEPDQRPSVLDAGEAKRAVHREANKENRAVPRAVVEERMDEETKGRSFRFVGITTMTTTDAFTGRPIRNAYEIQDLADDARYDVSRGTCRWLAEKGRLEDFTGVVKGRKTVAQKVGAKSVADLLDGGPGVIASTVEKAEETSGGTTAGISDSELEDLLSTLND